MTLRIATLLMTVTLVSACGTTPAATTDDDAAPDVSTTDTAIGTDATATTDAEATWQPGRKWPNTQETAAKGALSAGIAQGYLDSPIGVSMAGYGNRNTGLHSTWCEASKASRGFWGKMTIKAMALQVGAERLVFVKSPLLTSESFLLDAIVAEHLLGQRRFAALWLGLECAGGDGDVDAYALRLLILALLCNTVGADGGAGGVVLQLAVARYVDAVLVVTGHPFVMTARGREGGRQPQTRYQKQERSHLCYERSCVVK